jgi:hypothetical protein
MFCFAKPLTYADFTQTNAENFRVSPCSVCDRPRCYAYPSLLTGSDYTITRRAKARLGDRRVVSTGPALSPIANLLEEKERPPDPFMRFLNY